MNLFKRLAWDSLWLLIARIGAQGSMVIVTYLLARRLGTAGFGEYALIATAIVIGNTLTTFGSDMVLIREIAAKGDFAEVPSILILQLFLSSLFIGFVFLFASSLPNQTSDSVLALKAYSLALIPLAFFTVFTSMLRGAQRMALYSWLNLGVAILQVTSITIFIQRGASILRLAYLLLGVQVAGTVFAGLLCLSLLTNAKDWHFSLNQLFSLFAICLPVALIAILGIFYQKISLAMLSFLGTASMVGLFSAAARVMEAARIGHIAVLTALYPAMVNTSQENTSNTTFRFSLFLLLVFSTGVSAILFLFARLIVDIFFGAEYRSSIPVLKILSFTLVPYTINSFLSLTFLAKKKEKIVVRVLGISLLLLLILNLWLIPRAGQVGAGWAVLATESVQATLFLWTWLSNSLHQMENPPPKGVSYELSDLP